MGINYFTCNVTEVCRVTDNNPSSTAPMKRSIRGLRNIATELCCTEQDVMQLERDHALGVLLYKNNKKGAVMRLNDVERAKQRLNTWKQLDSAVKQAMTNCIYIEDYWQAKFNL